MSRVAIVVFLFAAICAVSANNVSESESTALDVITLEGIDEYMAKHPEIELEKEQTRSGFRFTFTFGNRTNGDRLVRTVGDSINSFQPQTFSANFTYPPPNETGVNVTSVRIVVDVSSNHAQASIVGGGIGQRQIVVRIEARSTLYFIWTADVFSSGDSRWSNYCSILMLPIMIISAYFAY